MYDFHNTYYNVSFQTLNFRAPINLGESMWKLRDEWTDLSIICDNGQSEIRAHKFVLSAASTLLNIKLVYSDKLNLPLVSKSELESILESIYTSDANSGTNISQLETFMLNDIEKIGDTSKKQREEDISSKSAKLQRFCSNSIQIKKSCSNSTKQQNTSPVPSLSMLPNEVKSHILSYLPTKEILTKIACLSKQFYQLSKSPYVHNVLTVSPHPKTPSFIKSALLATEICLTMKRSTLVDEELTAAANLTNLKVLNVSGKCLVSVKTFITMEQSTWWPNLTQFRMSIESDNYYKLVADPQFDLALSELGSSGNITVFYLGYCLLKRVFSPAKFNLIKGPTFAKLERLTIDDTYSEEMLKEIVLARKDSLQNLAFHSNYTPPISFDFLSQIPNLNFLSLLTPLLSLKPLSNLKKLKYLAIAKFDHQMAHEASEMEPNSLPKLRSINIGHNLNCACRRPFRHDTILFCPPLPILLKLVGACPNLTVLRIYSPNESLSLMSSIITLRKACPKLKVFTYTSICLMYSIDCLKL